eukprot:5303895-Pyramimonas_sp.AAC.1
MGSKDRAAPPMRRRCIGDVGDASATSARRTPGSTASRIADVSARRRDPTRSTRTPFGRPRIRYDRGLCFGASKCTA